MKRFVLIFLLFIPLTAISEESEIAKRMLDGLIQGKEINAETLGLKQGWSLPILIEALNGCESAIINPTLKSYTEKYAKSLGTQPKKDWAYSGRTMDANMSSELHTMYAILFSGNITAQRNALLLMPQNMCMCQYEQFAKKYTYNEFMSASSSMGAPSNKAFEEQLINTSKQCMDKAMKLLTDAKPK